MADRRLGEGAHQSVDQRQWREPRRAEEAALLPLYQFERSIAVDSGSPNLAECVLQVTRSFERGIQQMRQGLLAPDELPSYVFDLEGPLGTGKTFSQHAIMLYLGRFLLRLRK